MAVAEEGLLSGLGHLVILGEGAPASLEAITRDAVVVRQLLPPEGGVGPIPLDRTLGRYTDGEETEVLTPGDVRLEAEGEVSQRPILVVGEGQVGRERGTGHLLVTQVGEVHLHKITVIVVDAGGERGEGGVVLHLILLPVDLDPDDVPVAGGITRGEGDLSPAEIVRPLHLREGATDLLCPPGAG